MLFSPSVSLHLELVESTQLNGGLAAFSCLAGKREEGDRRLHKLPLNFHGLGHNTHQTDHQAV